MVRRDGCLYMWLPSIARWLDLESDDAKVALRDFYFIVSGVGRVPRDAPPLVSVADLELFGPMPWRVVTYDMLVAPHPGLAEHLRTRGYEVNRRPVRRPG